MPCGFECGLIYLAFGLIRIRFAFFCQSGDTIVYSQYSATKKKRVT